MERELGDTPDAERMLAESKKLQIEVRFAALLKNGEQYSGEADILITEYAEMCGIEEHDADLQLHAAAEDVLDSTKE